MSSRTPHKSSDLESVYEDFDTHISVFFVSNVHCASCVAYITEVLSETPSVKNIEVTILTHEVRASHSTTVRPADLVNDLIHAAFEVHHATTFDQRGRLITELDTSSWNHRGSTLFSSPRTSVSSISSNIKGRIQTNSHKRHIANCDACRKEELEALSRHSTSRTELGLLDKISSQSSFRPLRKHHQQDITAAKLESTTRNAAEESLRSVATSETNFQPDVSTTKLHTDAAELSSSSAESANEFTAQISVGGMSCASCANSITAQVQQLEFVKNITVNLLTNSATVIYVGPRDNVDEIVEQINDAGFKASLDEVNQAPKPPVSRELVANYVSEIAITGMTCGSCVGGVTRGLEELPFIRGVSVNLLSHSGRVEFEGRENLDKIIERIEDLGYDATVNSVSPLKIGTEKLGSVQIRTVSILVAGMFCHHCPQTVLGAVNSLPGVNIEEALSEKNPILKVAYTPQPPFLTVRTIISTINSANENFRATIYHPPSIEDRSRAIQHHERSRLLARLLFVFISAIPTFIIGIVFMSLVAPENSVRMYLEQTMWSGGVTRIEWALFILSTPVMFYGTDVFHVRAMKEVYALWRPGSRVPILRRFYRFGSMNLLISAGTSVAYISSLAVLIVDAVVGTKSSPHSTTYFDSVVFLTLFILAGRFLEAYSKAKTGDAVTSLGKLRPSEALLSDDTSEDGVQRTSVDLLEVGDVVSIPHGASPPADGVIVDSASYQFDESSLTGESRPVKKTVNDMVYTGSVNVGQPVRIRITELGGSSMLDRIIAVVREGQSKRAPLERVADLLTSHFVPIITLIAILTFVIWLALGHSGVLPADYLDVAHGGWTFWALEFAISVFVVACPCGLALAAPTALFVGGGLAAKHGILVKGGGEAFQEASRLNAIVFDKTGTLTEGGSLKVSDHEILTSDPEVAKVAWALARKMEESSNHPIAQAITEFCKTQQSSYVKSSDVHEISGQGMKGTFTVSGSGDDIQYEAAIGNERLLNTLLSPDTDTYFVSNLLAKYQSAGKSTAILSLRQVHPPSTEPAKFIPAITFATSDTIRPEAIDIISQLQKRHVDVFMCTGDNQTTAHAVADMLGIPRSKVIANVLPAEKASFVRQIQECSLTTPLADGNTTPSSSQSRSIVAFVGDGVNDSPALAAADVSIAMASGSDVAINSASFILLNSDLSTILQLVLLSRRVFNRVRMNFGWAVIYNLCLVPIAAGVLYPIASGHHQKTIDGDMIMVNEHWRLSPVWAALAMALSSISVVLSSLALRIDKESFKKIVRWKR
ncbi:Copper resistance-associated P-type ATPase, putative [Penicillium digitatum]|uniref:Copper resistance-associated P-type ATPase, putative n=3 Tax=Penicillium digitatum TaxID=36651 RepID=K9G5Y1_PEND2|nr:Copper resistance-associated P-type ATPase, putative [Penicillium digitatum Pd1]EKV07362.1 Copper resistance-associated P-type ATPase, putative [Penicillium digitatum Pd1]EKV08656.1 Copper resistance-associated P-type ATPase, putative [Penicillium digitatum PHI26]QQK41140.1 Copper resistance-associated P-type ATPase, putative [Penicillium digitatum]